MPTIAGQDQPELTPTEFARARREMMLTGSCDMRLFQKASFMQAYALHQIELTVNSIEEEHMRE
jgi:hypothetical protein